MLDRISDTLRLFALRTAERFSDLSPTGKILAFLIFVALVALARHFGILPARSRVRGM